jgi:hypothetical protein
MHSQDLVPYGATTRFPARAARLVDLVISLPGERLFAVLSDWSAGPQSVALESTQNGLSEKFARFRIGELA